MQYDDYNDDGHDTAPCCLSLEDIKRIVSGLQSMAEQDAWPRHRADEEDLI